MIQANMNSVLSIKNVNQIFRTGFWLKKTQILFDVNIEVPENSIFGFIGPNGAGKTTLIHILIGLRQPISGSVQVGGFDSISKSARAQIGYLPERPYFQEYLTGRQFLEYMGTLSGMNRDQLQKRIPVVLNEVGLSHAEGRELRKYSKGMLQRIGIAQAILHDPKLLILDEPMSGLDPIGRKEMRDLILKLSREGKTIFFTSHVIPDVEAICDRVAMIHKGKIVSNGSVSDLLSSGEARFELVCSGAVESDFDQLKNMIELQKVSEGFKLTLPTEKDANRAIELILSKKGQIISLNPIRSSLEDYFESEVRANVQ